MVILSLIAQWQEHTPDKCTVNSSTLFKTKKTFLNVILKKS